MYITYMIAWWIFKYVRTYVHACTYVRYIRMYVRTYVTALSKNTLIKRHMFARELYVLANKALSGGIAVPVARFAGIFSG